VRFLWAILLLWPVYVTAGTLSSIGDARWVTVARVYDGDTFETRRGEKVRFLNLNTPEIQHRDSQAEPGGDVAKRALSELMLGKQVRLRLDREKRDHYGRTLAQVWMRDGLWVNAWLLRQGYAHLYNFEPNTRWAGRLQKEEQLARQERLGIWKLSRFKEIDSRYVSKKHLGEFHVVHGRVLKTPHRKGWSFQMKGLNVSIPRAYRGYFKSPPRFKRQQRVTVHGKIRISRRGQFFLALHSPYDLEIK